jgi:hypothetical protein
MADSPKRSPLSLMIGRVLITIGCMNTQMSHKCGCSVRKCTTGLDGKMEPMSCLLTSQRLVGNTSQTEASTQLLTLFRVSTFQSMFTITGCTLMPMKSQENREARRELHMDNSYQLDSSHLKTNGSE